MSNSLFEEYRSKIKLIVSEVDGIITEDLSPLIDTGQAIF